jgi:hypothetical protein
MTAKEQSILKALEKLLKKYSHILTDAADTIRTQDISNYPIFVATQQEVEIGIPLILKGQLGDNWEIKASTLEEFHAKQIILTERIDAFREVYKKKSDELCIAALMEDGAKFLFIP